MAKRATHPKPMGADELMRILEQLGLMQEDLSALVNVGSRTVRNWKLDSGQVTDGGAVVLLRLLEKHPDLLSEAWTAAGMPEGRGAAPRGKRKKTDQED